MTIEESTVDQDKAEDLADNVVRAVTDLVEKLIDLKTGQASYYATEENERNALRNAVLEAMGMRPVEPRGEGR